MKTKNLTVGILVLLIFSLGYLLHYVFSSPEAEELETVQEQLKQKKQEIDGLRYEIKLREISIDSAKAKHEEFTKKDSIATLRNKTLEKNLQVEREKKRAALARLTATEKEISLAKRYNQSSLNEVAITATINDLDDYDVLRVNYVSKDSTVKVYAAELAARAETIAKQSATIIKYHDLLKLVDEREDLNEAEKKELKKEIRRLRTTVALLVAIDVGVVLLVLL